MTMGTRTEVIREHLQRYLQASKKEKGEILDALAHTLGMHRKAVVRALGREFRRDTGAPRRKPGRRVVYDGRVTVALKEVWIMSTMLCGELLHPIIPEYVRCLERDRMWRHDRRTTEKLLLMSLGTMKGRIAAFSRIKAGGGRSTTKPSDLKELIPIRRGPWENPEPGYGEIDTVVHCGPTALGSMAYTVNFTDIATCWIESRAQIDKGQERTLTSIQAIQRQLPFPLKGLDPDTGSEFINWHVKGWCDKEGVELTRSRPNHRNDNAHIEQKNYTTVRKFFGYARIDQQEAVDVMNELYGGPLRLYRNFFLPTMKCIEKVRVGSKYIRQYDTPKTPYQRVLAHPDIAQEAKDELTLLYATLNPLVLRREIDTLIRRIFKLQQRAR